MCWCASGQGRTNATVVACEAIFLKHNLVTVCLQNRQAVGRLSEDQTRLSGIAFSRGVVFEELLVPDFFLSFPVDDGAPLDRPSELNLAEIAAFIKVGSYVDLSRPVSRYTIGDDTRIRDVPVANHARFQGVRSIVEDQGRLGASWFRILGLASARHEACWVDKTAALMRRGQYRRLCGSRFQSRKELDGRRLIR